jgi:hypothetical protein
MTDRELMQQALDALEGYARNCRCEGGGAPCDAAEALRARLAQPEQEPVWVEVTTNTGDKFILDSAVEADKIRAAKNVGLSVVSLYTAPPQREWQGLTKEEARELCVANVPYVVDMVAALEARLKEKNT